MGIDLELLVFEIRSDSQLRLEEAQLNNKLGHASSQRPSKPAAAGPWSFRP